jgi:hypothetical protein
MSTRVRELTTDEKARVKEALQRLQAPYEKGEPVDQLEFYTRRFAAFRAEYPDVAALFGEFEADALIGIVERLQP